MDLLEGRLNIHVGDCIDALRAMAPDSVDCVVTSPPYWGLRDYGVAGQIGLESTLAEHLAVMVDVFREVRRVLKPTGTCWVNYGDCYATTPNGRSAAETKQAGGDDRTFRDKPFSTVGPIYVEQYEKTDRSGAGCNRGNVAAAHGGRVIAGGYLKPKDLCMIPNRLAIALQDDGWWVRSEIIWGKTNPMPDSSGAARPSTAHEKIFMLTKSEAGDVWRARDTGEISFLPDLSERCALVTDAKREGPRWIRIGAYYDAEAVNMPVSASTNPRVSQDVINQVGSMRAHGGAKPNGAMKAVVRGRATHGKHTLGEALPGPNRRKEAAPGGRIKNNSDFNAAMVLPVARRYLRNYEPAPLVVWPITTQPFSEAHFATFPPELAERCILAGCPRGGLVLDPFGGAGTTALVALRHGRRAGLIELNADYAEIARRRILKEWRRPVQRPQVEGGHGPLFSEAAE